MQFLFLLLLCCQSIVAAYATSQFSDKWDRDLSETEYIVDAIDPTRTTETETLLKHLYGDTNVVANRHDDKVASWTITSDGSDLTSAIKALEAVRLVEPRGSPKTRSADSDAHSTKQEDSSNSPSVESGIPELVRRDVQQCSCLAKNTSDIQETEKFLESKIQSGSKMYQFTRHGKTIGWWYLALDPDAQKAVQGYEGFEYFKVGVQKMTRFRALPRSDSTQPPGDIGETSGKKNALSRRDGKWVKQTTEDKH